MSALNQAKALGIFRRASAGRGYKESSTASALAALKPFFAFLDHRGIHDLRDVNRSVVVAYMQSVNDIYKENTRRTLLVAIRRLFSILYQENLIILLPTEDLHFKAQIPTLREALSIQDMESFLSAIDIHLPLGLRDRSIFELMYSSALRSKELVNLIVDDINLPGRQILIRQTKNYQERLLPVTDVAAKFIGLYLPTKVDPSRPLFLSSHGGHLGPRVVNLRFLRWAKEAGVYREKLSAHSVRHSCARHLLSGGANIRFVQELLGHKSIESTEVYTLENDENIKRIYKQYHPRENRLYQEVTDEYLENLEELVKQLEQAISKR